MGSAILVLVVAVKCAPPHSTSWFIAPLALLAFVFGLVLSVFSRIMAWWHHG